jgi:hypothetical protein
LLIGFELDAFDNTMTGFVEAALAECPVGADTCVFEISGAGTENVAVPGATQIRANLPSPRTVDNGANTYIIRVSLTGGPNARLTGLRVFYRLQVSPAPAVASFGDVPTGTHSSSSSRRSRRRGSPGAASSPHRSTALTKH